MKQLSLIPLYHTTKSSKFSQILVFTEAIEYLNAFESILEVVGISSKFILETVTILIKSAYCHRKIL